MVFVTGGTGLLGSHLLVELSKQHDNITAIYRNQSKIERVKSVFYHYLKEEAENYFKKIIWVACDILDVPKLEEVMEGHKVIYHCAGFVSFARRDFSSLIEINRYGTANMVNVALSKKVDKFCHVSSTSAVGRKDIPSNVEITEKGKWILTEKTSGYSISKYSAEKEVWRGIHEGLNAVIVNPSIIFGYGNWDESSMKIFKRIKKGINFYSPGANAFVDARDVAKIMVTLMNQDIFNERFLCTGTNISFKEVFEKIAIQLDKKPPTFQVNKFLMGVAWRLSVLWGFITFSKPTLSRETARNAFTVAKFNSNKVKERIGHEFYGLDETIENVLR